MENRKNSERLFDEAAGVLVGGVNSPVRAYRGYDFAPPFIERAKGSHLWDADGNEYIDYVGSWGPMILGHANPVVVESIKEAAENGASFGAPTERETKLAELVKEAFPSIDLVRFVSSGTEATMSAIRAARGFTGRDKIIKFNGCYHGHSDYLLVKAGSGLATFSEPDSSGVPADFAKHTLVAEYNDLENVSELINDNKGEVAAIIVEPIAGNMGCVPPAEGFLEGLRKICNENGIVLIFDEVITGFRVSFGGAQKLYGIKPDLTCLGKILGGGLPMGAYGGRKDIMEKVSPLGPVYQAGTLSGNPLAVAAGFATLNILKGDCRHCEDEGRSNPEDVPTSLRAERSNPGLYSELNKTTLALTTKIDEVLTAKKIPHTLNHVGSIFSFFFAPEKVHSYRDAEKADRKLFDKYFIHMLDNGIYLAPSPFECTFVSVAHTDKDIEETISTVNSWET